MSIGLLTLPLVDPELAVFPEVPATSIRVRIIVMKPAHLYVKSASVRQSRNVVVAIPFGSGATDRETFLTANVKLSYARAFCISVEAIYFLKYAAFLGSKSAFSKRVAAIVKFDNAIAFGKTLLPSGKGFLGDKISRFAPVYAATSRSTVPKLHVKAQKPFGMGGSGKGKQQGSGKESFHGTPFCCGADVSATLKQYNLG
jgi:hypothetical protein